MDFQNVQNFMKIEFCERQIFENSIIHKPSLELRDVPHKNFDLIGSAVLTFIGHKQTDRKAKYIYRFKHRYTQIETSIDGLDIYYID